MQETDILNLLFLLLLLLLILMCVGRILICDRITNKDSLLLLLSSACGLSGSVLRVLRVEQIPLDSHE